MGITQVGTAIVRAKKGANLIEDDVLNSAKLALKDAGITINAANAYNIGLFIGATLFNFNHRKRFFGDYLKGGIRMVNPAAFPGTLISCLGGNLCIALGIKGANVTVSTGDSAGRDALFAAQYFLERNNKNIALVIEIEEKMVGAGRVSCRRSTCRVLGNRRFFRKMNGT